MLDEISIFTLEVIARCFLGEYATEDVLRDIGRVLPTYALGFISVPFRLPWPLNTLPAFSFGKSIDARNDFKEIFQTILQAHRAGLASAEDCDEQAARAGVLNLLLEMQRGQLDSGGAKGGEVVFDDNFIFDNVRKTCGSSVFHPTFAARYKVL